MPPIKAGTAVAAPKKRKAEGEATAEAAKKPKATPPFPGKISKNCTIAQLEQEAKTRGLNLGNVKHDKASLLKLLGDGSASVIALNNKATKTKANATTSTTKKAPAATNAGSKTKATASTKAAVKPSKATTAPKKSSAVADKKATKPTAAKPKATTATKKTTAPAKAKSPAKPKKTTALGEQPAATKNPGEQPAVAKKPAIAKPKSPAKVAAKPKAKPASAKQGKVVDLTQLSHDPLTHIKTKATATKKKVTATKPIYTLMSEDEAQATVKKSIETGTPAKASRRSAPPKAKSTASAVAPPSKAAAASSASTSKSKKAAEPKEPRISDKLTLAQLNEEVTARQLNPMVLPSLKSDLLHYLVDGTIHVAESKEYKAYQALLGRVENEKGDLYEASLQKKLVKDAKKEELERQRYEKKQQKIREQQIMAQKAREEQMRNEREQKIMKQKAREDEKLRQKALHKHSFPRVHCHPLAEMTSLSTNGVPREGTCDMCSRGWFGGNSGHYSCEECDWDICKRCFEWENKTDKQKQEVRLAEQKRKAEEERQRIERQKRQEEEKRRAKEQEKVQWDEERRRRADEIRRYENNECDSEEEQSLRWDAKVRFKSSIAKPLKKNKDSNSMLKFTVWCSDGYDNDGWHSYGGSPTKEFDSSWNTKKEANQRAEYLFFWKNPWGIDPEEVDDESGDPEPTTRDGMNKWTVAPPESSRWTVGVVPASAYRHMENTSMRRHNYDSDHTSSSCNEHLSFTI